MRCQEVIHHLSIQPVGAPPSALLNEHLAGCASCTAWAERNARLDRLWETTRGPELSAAAWDRIWSNVSESLEPAPAPTLVSAPPLVVSSRSWRRPAMAIFALAQAAALLLAFGLAWRQSPSSPRPASPVPAANVPTATVAEAAPTAAPEANEIPAFDISPDQLTLISLDDKTVHDLPKDESPNEVSLFSLPMFNAMESLASLQ